MQMLNQANKKQKGVALIIFTIIFALAATAFLVSQLDGSGVKIERDKRTAAVLARAKQALIGWSISSGSSVGTARPGELPCPDNDAPGAFGYGEADGSCVVGKVGRLPWKTLGIEELTDGYGEPLWYSIDGAFRKRFGASPTTNQPINSDTRATTQIYAADGVTLITGTGMEVAAVIFATAQLLNGQSRSSGIVACAATGTSLAEHRCASNYLDAQSGLNNAINGGPFIRGIRSDTFNDQLIFVSASELMQSVEKRVGRELKTILQGYYASNGYYPYPAKYDDTNCLEVGNLGYTTDCQSDANICRGRFPDEALPMAWGASLPDWFTFNLWGQTIYYSAGTNALASAPLGCSAALTVDLASNNALLILAGSPLGAAIRNNPSESLNLSDYLEDAENQDGWSGLANDIYVTPSVITNDSLYALP